jgi:hypothetical protein
LARRPGNRAFALAGSNAMNVFDLHSAVVADYSDFVRSLF